MRQAGLIIVLLIGGVAGTVAAHAQAPPPNVHRIGYLSAAGSMDQSTEAFRQGLRDLGYIEGQNTAVEYRFAEGQYERLPQLAADLVRLPVEVIVTAGQNAARAARQQTPTLPIVVAAGGSWDGLATSLARPGGNVTGLSFLSPELGGERLALLREAAPTATRVAVLVNAPLQWAAVREAAGRLGVTLLRVEFRRASEFDAVFQAAAKQGGQAVLMFRDAVVEANRARVIALATRHRLPAMYEQRDFVEAGGFLAYGPSLPDLFRHAAIYVDKILKGARPGDLPIEQPVKFELAVNLKVAKTLGLTVPQSVLLQADEVIQ